MKNRTIKRLLSWMMCAVLITGEFGCMPMDAYAHEGIQTEEEAEKICEEEAETVREEEVATASEEEPDGIVPSYDTYDAKLSLDDKVISWTPREEQDSFDLSDDNIYRSEGRAYISGTGYDYGVSTTPFTVPDKIDWLGNIDLVRWGDPGSYTVSGNMSLGRVITDMTFINYAEGGNEVFPTGTYYLFVRKNIDGEDCISDRGIEFSYTNGASGPSGAGPAVAECHQGTAYVKWDRIKGEYEYYQCPEGEPWPSTAPEGYEEIKNLMMAVADPGEERAGYIIVPDSDFGMFINDRTENNGEYTPKNSYYAKLYEGEGDLTGYTSGWVLADSYVGGFKVAAVDYQGNRTAFVDAVKMSPMLAEGMDSWNASIENENGVLRFKAPEITRLNDSENGNDGCQYVKNVDYGVYLTKTDATQDSERWVLLEHVESRTLREGDEDYGYIELNSVILEAYKKQLTTGTYTMTVVCYTGAASLYDKQTYETEIPAFEADNTLTTTFAVRSRTAWVKKVEDNGGYRYEEYERGEDDERSDEQVETDAKAAGYDIPMKSVQVVMPEQDGILGYVVDTNDLIVRDGDTSHEAYGIALYGRGTGRPYTRTCFDFLTDKTDESKWNISVKAFNKDWKCFGALRELFLDYMEWDTWEADAKIEGNVLTFEPLDFETFEGENSEGRYDVHVSKVGCTTDLEVMEFNDGFSAKNGKIEFDLGNVIAELNTRYMLSNPLEGDFNIVVTGGKFNEPVYRSNVVTYTFKAATEDESLPEPAAYTQRYEVYVKQVTEEDGSSYFEEIDESGYNALPTSKKAEYKRKTKYDIIVDAKDAADKGIIAYLVSTEYALTDMEGNRSVYDHITPDNKWMDEGYLNLSGYADKETLGHVQVSALYGNGKKTKWAEAELWHDYLQAEELDKTAILSGDGRLVWDAFPDTVKYVGEEGDNPGHYEFDDSHYDVYVTPAGGSDTAREINYQWADMRISDDGSCVSVDLNSIILNMAEEAVFNEDSGLAEGKYEIVVVGGKNDRSKEYRLKSYDMGTLKPGVENKANPKAVNATREDNSEQQTESTAMPTLSLAFNPSVNGEVGYLVKLTDGNVFRFSPEEERNYTSILRGENPQPYRNIESENSFTISAPTTAVRVSAVYGDGSISEWTAVRKRESYDDYTETADLEVTKDTDAQTISWKQEYYENEGVKGYPELYAVAPDGRWLMLEDLGEIEWDREGGKASVGVDALLRAMAFRKFSCGEMIPEGNYGIKVVRNIDGKEYVSSQEVTQDIKFDTAVETDLDANYSVTDSECTVRVMHDPAPETPGAAAFIIHTPDGIMFDTESDSKKYEFCKTDDNENGRYAAECGFTFAQFGTSVEVAAIFYDGTVSDWVSAHPYSIADDYMKTTTGTVFDKAGYVSNTKFSDGLDISTYQSIPGSEYNVDLGVDGVLFRHICDAQVILEGSDYEVPTRVLVSDQATPTYRIDKVCLPASAAIDALHYEARDKYESGDDWNYLESGTYTTRLLVRNQNEEGEGFVSEEYGSFSFRTDDAAVAAPVEPSYEREGDDYKIYVSDYDRFEAVAFIIKYERDDKTEYDWTAAGNSFEGVYGDNVRICAVNKYGNISEWVTPKAKVESLVEGSLDATVCNKEYNLGYEGQIIFSGATVNVERYDNTEETMEIYELARELGGTIGVSGWDKNTPGNQVLTVKLNATVGDTVVSHTLGTMAITVKDVNIPKITADIELEKDEYFVGQTPSIKEGSSVTVEFSDGSSRVIKAPSASLTLEKEVFKEEDVSESCRISVLLDGKVLHMYENGEEGAEVSVSTRVLDRTVTGISVIPPSKTEFFVKEEVTEADYADGIAVLEFNDGSVEKMYLNTSPDLQVTGYNTDSAAEAREITVTHVASGEKAAYTVKVKEPAVVSLGILSNTGKKIYTEGEELNLSGVTLKAAKDNGETSNISLPDAAVTAVPASIKDKAPGMYEVKLYYGGKYVPIYVTVKPREVRAVTVAQAPVKMNYVAGEKLDLSGLILHVEYDDGIPAEDIPIENILSEIDVSGFNSKKPGLQLVTITYGGYSLQIEVRVKAVDRIELVSRPTRTEYVTGQKADFAGGRIMVYYVGQPEPEGVDMTVKGVSFEYDNTKAGEQTVLLTYGRGSCTFTLNYIAKAVNSIAIVSKPSKTEYYVDEDISATDGKLKVTYNDGTEETIDITAAMLSGYDKTQAGRQTVTVTYGEKTATFEVTVLANTVAKIEIASAPTKLVYDYGSELDPAGGKITVTFDNNETMTVDITADMISGYDKTKAGKQTITVTFAEKTATFEVTVNEKKAGDKDPDVIVVDPTKPAEPVVGDGIKYGFIGDDIRKEADGYHMIYTSAKLKPVVYVTDNGVPLTEGVDYSVSYKNNLNAGPATAVIKGKGKFTGNYELGFIIEQRDIHETEVGSLVVKTGGRPKPVVAYAGNVLSRKDYELSVAGDEVTIKGIGNFKDTRTEKVISNVSAADYKKMTIKAALKKSDFAYDGTPKTIEELLTVTDGSGARLSVSSNGYAISYSDNVNAGTVMVTVIGTGSYVGREKLKYKIKPYKGTDFKVACEKECDYTAGGTKPAYITVSNNRITGGYLREGRDYSVKYKNNKKGGVNASFKITFKGNYKGSRYTGDNTYKVNKPALDRTAVSGNYAIVGDMVFTKKGKYHPKAYLIIDGKLVKTAEYSLEYSESGALDGERSGLEVTAIAKDRKNYRGKVTVRYNVIAGDKIDVNKAKIVLKPSGKKKTYAGAGEGVTLEAGTDYTVKVGSTAITDKAEIEKNFTPVYADNTKDGKATMILIANGEKYVGAFAANYTIKKLSF